MGPKSQENGESSSVSIELPPALVNLLTSLTTNQTQFQEAFKQLLETPKSGSKFRPFDSQTELWPDYLERFETHCKAFSSQQQKVPYFLDCQTEQVYKQLQAMAESKRKKITDQNWSTICSYMQDIFDVKKFVLSERWQFWKSVGRKGGETINQLADRARRLAATCDFRSIKDPLDASLTLWFLCSIQNKSTVKAILSMDLENLTFDKAVTEASRIEDMEKIAKSYIEKESHSVHSVHKSFNRDEKPVNSTPATKETRSDDSYRCNSCGKAGHQRTTCRFRRSACNYCSRTGHIEAACRKKASDRQNRVNTINTIGDSGKCYENIYLNNTSNAKLELDSGSSANFLSKKLWQTIGSPVLQKSATAFDSATLHKIPVLGQCTIAATKDGSTENVTFWVTSMDHLNILGRSGIQNLRISLDKHLLVNSVLDVQTDYKQLESQCKEVAKEFPSLFEPGLGCLKDFELEVKFKPDFQERYCRPRSVPFALVQDLEEAYEQGIRKGVWSPTQFNRCGTPVVPIKKALKPGQSKRDLRVCGDYSIFINQQLEPHRMSMPLPDDLMRKLKGGIGFSKIDLADAYNQIKLAPESAQRLALSTHKSILLQLRLPFGILSAPGYFQEIMEYRIGDIPGVVIYMDDILVSGSSCDDHLKNLRSVLQRLQEMGLRCNLHKCEFAKPSVEYLGHTLTATGIAKGKSKLQGVLQMPKPTDVATLRSFLGHVMFYHKFLPPNLSEILNPFHQLLRKGVQWQWTSKEDSAFKKVIDLLSSDSVLVHYSADLPLGLATDASQVGIGCVLFHRYPDGSERPIYNCSKSLNSAQKRYGMVQLEALAIIFGLKKFHQFLFGRHFILVVDHKPSLALFGPSKPIPAMAANRLARWALQLSQYDYEIEYRSTHKHGNVDALSRLPSSSDSSFDREEEEDDVQTVLLVQWIGKSVSNSNDSLALIRESDKDPVITTAIRYATSGWPCHIDSSEKELRQLRAARNSLSVSGKCLFYGQRAVVPRALRPEVLEILHSGHFGVVRMRQLARTTVYWPGIDSDIDDLSKACLVCAEHARTPPEAALHPWLLPEKPWSRIHIDHAVRFMNQDWLIVIDAFSKFPIIHPVRSTSAQSTIECLETDFALFGFPHALVSDNASSFTADDFEEWLSEKGVVHLTGAPYHPSSNGQVERMVQSFKNFMLKSRTSPHRALQEFLMLYRRTPLPSGLSPSELLNNRQIRASIDLIFPLQTQVRQRQQCQAVMRAGSNKLRTFNVNDLVFVTDYRSHGTSWVLARVIAVRGSRLYEVVTEADKLHWRRHIDQIKRAPQPVPAGSA